MKNMFLAVAISTLTMAGANASSAFVDQIGPNLLPSLASRAVSIQNIVLPVNEFTGAIDAARAEVAGSLANVASVQQNGFANIVGLQQSGSANYGLIVQQGVGNSANLAQLGNNNVGLISQMGYGNAVSLTQAGNNHAAIVTQQGRGNVAIIAQR